LDIIVSQQIFNNFFFNKMHWNLLIAIILIAAYTNAAIYYGIKMFNARNLYPI